jgi:hypothetical protein
MTVPDTRLNPADAVELGELLQYLADWLASDHDRLDASLTRFVGNPAYGLNGLRDDLRRFAFLLGVDDGEWIFGNE